MSFVESSPYFVDSVNPAFEVLAASVQGGESLVSPLGDSGVDQSWHELAQQVADMYGL